MKRFQFPLQKVLDLREFEEDQARIELGKAIAESERIRRQLENLAEEKARTVAGASDEKDVRQLIVREHYLIRLDANRDELLAELLEADALVENRRAVFAEAMKNRKVLSKLKDRRFGEYRKDVQTAEDTAVDDLSSARYSGSGSSPSGGTDADGSGAR